MPDDLSLSMNESRWEIFLKSVRESAETAREFNLSTTNAVAQMRQEMQHALSTFDREQLHTSDTVKGLRDLITSVASADTQVRTVRQQATDARDAAVSAVLKNLRTALLAVAMVGTLVVVMLIVLVVVLLVRAL